MALTTHAQQKGLIPIYRYFIPADSSYVTEAGNEDNASSWTDKKLLFYAYSEPGAGRLPIYSWYNGEKRRYVSIAEDEWSDEQMNKKGYTGKRLQFYALTQKGPGTVMVYRYLNARNKGWATATEGDALISGGDFRRKTFQYFAVAADH